MKRLQLSAVVVAGLIAGLAACSSKTIPTPSAAPYPSSGAGVPTTPPATPAVTDAQFVQQAATAGTEEVLQAQVETAANGADATTQTFAQKMIADHTPNNQLLSQAASGAGFASQFQTGVSAAPPATYQTPSTYFNGQIAAHQQAIALFQSEIASGQNQQLVQYAQQTLPVLQMHLQMAQQDAANP